MDLRKVKKLIELVEESGIAELEVSSGDESIRIAMPSAQAAVPVAAAPTIVSQTAAGGSVAASRRSAEVRAPMAGTFYRAPAPDAQPFVDIGDLVQPDTVIGIIESMKMMHEIRAGEAGTVEAFSVGNGVPVNTGDVLIQLK